MIAQQPQVVEVNGRRGVVLEERKHDGDNAYHAIQVDFGNGDIRYVSAAHGVTWIDGSTGEITPKEAVSTNEPSLTVDAEFKSLIETLSNAEYESLSASIVTEGCREALIVWQEENILVDGHHRYAICMEHNVPFNVLYKSFDCREAVIVWMLENQLSRRNLSEPKRIQYVLRLKPAIQDLNEKRQRAGVNLFPNLGTGHTDDHLSSRAGVSHGKFHHAETILTKAQPFLQDWYTSGDITAYGGYRLYQALHDAPDEVLFVVERDHVDDYFSIPIFVEGCIKSRDWWRDLFLTGFIQIGDDHEAVKSTAGARAIKEAIELKAKIHRQLSASATAQDRLDRAQRLPNGVYSVVYADPAWQYENSGFDMSAAQQYDTMPLDKICTLLNDIDLQVADTAVLFLWATNPLLPEALQVITAWGFTYRTNLVWVKDRASGGFYARGQHEFLIVATKGGSFTPSALLPSLIQAPVTEHSKKPELHALIESMYPEQRYVELFARNNAVREGWDFWGNEANG